MSLGKSGEEDASRVGDVSGEQLKKKKKLLQKAMVSCIEIFLKGA